MAGRSSGVYIASSVSKGKGNADHGFSCVACHGRTSVLETRSARGGIRRRRVCLRCGKRMTTVEILSATPGHPGSGPMIAVSRRSLQRIALITEAALVRAGEPRQVRSEGEAGRPVSVPVHVPADDRDLGISDADLDPADLDSDLEGEA